MRLPNAAYQAHPWRISAIAPDFKLVDAWQLPVEGGPEDFDAFLQIMSNLNTRQKAPAVVRALFRLRDSMGRWFGWKDGGWDGNSKKLPIPGCTETTLRVRLPDDLKPTVPASERCAAKFRAVYRTSYESAEELSNVTVHAVKHLVWVDRGDGRYQGQMGVFVKPRGWFGALYMRLIGPFRRLLVITPGWKVPVAEAELWSGFSLPAEASTCRSRSSCSKAFLVPINARCSLVRTRNRNRRANQRNGD